MKNKIKAAYIAFLAITVGCGICIQFYISTVKYMAEGRTFGGAIVQLLSYFTIQNNMLIALALALILLKPASTWGRFFSRIAVLTAMTVYITIVGLVYQLILRKQEHHEGLFKLTNEIFHTLSPIMFVLFWLIFIPKGNIPWSRCLNWLIYPLIYFSYILVRGAISGFYPYNFLNAGLIGYQHIFINFFFLLLAFLAISLFFIAIDRFLKRGQIIPNHTSYS